MLPLVLNDDMSRLIQIQHGVDYQDMHRFRGAARSSGPQRRPRDYIASSNAIDGCPTRSGIPTDVATWTVVGRLTEPRDGPQLDEQYLGLGGTALVENGGRYYLIATPIASASNRYDGCNVYRFEDLTYGKLERRRGKLVVAQTVHGIPGTHHGACAAHSRLQGGILLSRIVSTAAPRVMQIRRSGVELPRD